MRDNGLVFAWPEPEEPLSAGGHARRARLRGELMAVVERRGRRRRRKRAAAFAAAALLLAWIAWRLPSPTSLPRSAPAPAPAAATWQLVEDRPELLSRWLVQDRAIRAEWLLDDDELQGWLVAAGYSPGFVRRGDTVWVEALHAP
jgi:hypothetical protein